MFFGCDVGKCSDRIAGVMDTALFDMKLAYGFSLNMTKAQRLETGESAVSFSSTSNAISDLNMGR